MRGTQNRLKREQLDRLFMNPCLTAYFDAVQFRFSRFPAQLHSNSRKVYWVCPSRGPGLRADRAAPLMPSARLATTDLHTECNASGLVSEETTPSLFAGQRGSPQVNFDDIHKEIASTLGLPQ
jgi:hypothetical protein